MSSFTKPLTTTYIGRGFRRVEKEFEYHVGAKDSKEIIVVPKGFKTDFASVPWPFSMIIPKDGDHNQAAVLHDFLYSLLGKYPGRPYTRKECDSIFLEAMGVIAAYKGFKISLVKRRTMYRAVRMGGGFGWRVHTNRAKKKKELDMKKVAKTMSIVVFCIMLQGCAIHYHNEKSISGKGKDIKTNIGKIDGAKAKFKSTLDVWFGSLPGVKKEKPADIEFLRP